MFGKTTYAYFHGIAWARLLTIDTCINNVLEEA
jgi:hypothetical protein